MGVINPINSIVPAEAGGIHSRPLGSPAAVSATAVMPATGLTASPQVGVTAGIVQPDVPRNVTAKGNASGIAGNVVVHGTDEFGNTITDTIALNGSTEVAGTKVFKTVTSVDLPAKTNSSGDTVSIGASNKLGLGRRLSRDTMIHAYLNGVREATRATLNFDPANVYANWVQLNSALNGNPVVVDFYQ
jgi:hypothetical protein